jgi:hypothetical protein
VCEGGSAEGGRRDVEKRKRVEEEEEEEEYHLGGAEAVATSDKVTEYQNPRKPVLSYKQHVYNFFSPGLWPNPKWPAGLPCLRTLYTEYVTTAKLSTGS